ncbi:MAG: cytochrome c biogenesis protein CcsA [Burkholderiales bacterium]|nr:cytochrome c biogenesis protein CcsA [Burkholderiales bacterium]
MAESLPYLANALLYGALAYYFWRGRWAAAAEGASAEGARVPAAFERFLVLAPLLIHTWLLARAVFAPDGMHLGVANAVSAILWLTVLVYFAGGFVYRLDGLQPLVLPVAAAAALLPALLPSARPLPNTEFFAFKLHLLIAMAAYSLLTIASLHVLLMTLIERRLHEGALSRPLRELPPLLSMEKLLFQIIWAGFILLTLTIASGVLYSEELFGKPAQFNHKNVFSVISWAIFAALLAGRHIHGWRGRVAVRWTLAGFLMLVLAYVGSKFVLEVLLGRA